MTNKVKISLIPWHSTSLGSFNLYRLLEYIILEFLSDLQSFGNPKAKAWS